MEQTILCPRCQQEKLPSEFYMKRDRRTPRPQYPCKECKAEVNRATYPRKRPVRPEGVKFCPRCKQEKPVDQFGRNRARSDGLQNYCRPCWLEYQASLKSKSVDAPTEGFKRCRRCRVVKILADFRTDARTSDGRHAYCVPCHDEFLHARWGRRLPDAPAGLKRCSKCQVVKPHDQFFKNRARPDGLRSYCKACHPTLPEVARDKPKKKARNVRYRRERRRTDPEFRKRENVRLFTNAAIRVGFLVPQACEFAATGECQGSIQAHHTDYDQPLQVRWLCEKHHLSHGHAGAYENPPQ